MQYGVNAPPGKGYGGYAHGPLNFGHEENRDGYTTKVTGMDTLPRKRDGYTKAYMDR